MWLAYAVTTYAETLDLYLDSSSTPLGVTPEHPVWSASRDGWVAAGDLYQGESVATMAGPAMVVGTVPAGDRTAYNLEVLGHHTYFVGDDGVWVHNAYPCPGNVVVTRYGTGGGAIQPGQVVVTGRPGISSYLRSGKLDPNPTNKVARIGDNTSMTVPRSSLGYIGKHNTSTPWIDTGPVGWFKHLIGQRTYLPK